MSSSLLGPLYRHFISLQQVTEAEQDAAGFCTPVPTCCFKYTPAKWNVAGSWSLGQAGLASLGTLEGQGTNAGVPELLTFPWAKPTQGLTACVPLELPLCL